MDAPSVDVRIEFNPPALEIVTRPYLVGGELEALAAQASAYFARSHRFRSPVEVVILNGGRYYHLAEALSEASGRAVPRVEVRSKRAISNGVWTARVEKPKALPPGDTLVIGDTLATGSTLAAVLEALGPRGRSVHVFTIAGAAEAAERLRREAGRLEGCGPITMTYANALFNLGANGTDLRFDGALYHPTSEREIERRLGAFRSQMKCAVWDWGDRFRNPAAHLRLAGAYYLSRADCPAYIVEGFRRRLGAPA